MRNDDYLVLVSLLLVEIGLTWAIGSLLWRELQRGPRVIRVYQGGRGDHDELRSADDSA